MKGELVPADAAFFFLAPKQRGNLMMEHTLIVPLIPFFSIFFPQGRNLLLGHTLIVPLVPLSLPLSLPLILFSVPMWVIPPVLGGKARRVRLMRDKGS